MGRHIVYFACREALMVLTRLLGHKMDTMRKLVYYILYMLVGMSFLGEEIRLEI